MQLNPYLTFDGRCEQAFKFYAKVLGGADEVSQRCPIVGVGDAPVQPAPDGLGIDAEVRGDVVFAQPCS